MRSPTFTQNATFICFLSSPMMVFFLFPLDPLGKKKKNEHDPSQDYETHSYPR